MRDSSSAHSASTVSVCVCEEMEEGFIQCSQFLYGQCGCVCVRRAPCIGHSPSTVGVCVCVCACVCACLAAQRPAALQVAVILGQTRATADPGFGPELYAGRLSVGDS